MNNFQDHPPRLTIVTALAVERKILAQPPAPDITIHQCGMGCASAYSQASELPTTILGNIGVSGALDPDLLPGTVIVADAVYYHQSSSPRVVYHPDAGLVEMLTTVLNKQEISFRRGAVLCVDEPLLTPADKARAHNSTGALAVDMESAGVAQAAMGTGQPFFCLRVVCDPAERRLEAELLAGVDHRGNSRLFPLLAAVCRRPRLVGGLVRMAGDFSQAAAGMRRAWQAIRQPLLDRARSESAARSPEGYGQRL